MAAGTPRSLRSAALLLLGSAAALSAALPGPSAQAMVMTVESAAAGATPRAWPGRYAVYENPRFGQTVEYPAELFTESSDIDNGAGRKFTTADGAATFSASGIRNDAHWSVRDVANLSERYYEQKGAEVSYVRTGDIWYVLSATHNGRIFYEKGMITHGGRTLNTLLVEYPEAWKPRFGPVVARLSHSFRVGPADDLG